MISSIVAKLRAASVPVMAALACSFVPNAHAENANSLTRSEELSGWELLFDGKSADHWRNYQRDTISDGWKIVDDALVRAEKGAGDIVSKEKYQYFELSLEFKISEGGNSGVMFHVTEDNPRPWHSGPEIQVQDNKAGHDPQKAGWLYQLYRPTAPSWTGETDELDATRPVGQWNQMFLRISPKNCEVAINGQLYYRFNLGSKDWDKRVAQSKFAKFEGFGKAGEGHICLQDHNDLVSYRSIKVRRLGSDGSAPQPITGKLNVKSSLAFPNLKWEGWEPIDEDGRQRKAMRLLELTYAKGDDRLFAIAQRGLVYSFPNTPDASQAKIVLDLQYTVSQFPSRGANEQGLLGLAMHPNFNENGQFFVCYTRDGSHQSVVSRFEVNDSGVANRASEKVILELDQPYQNHNGGSIEFGPDGYLYVSFGDGGSRNDPVESGQDRNQLLGSVLRIDIDHAQGNLAYAIPQDNPFVNADGARPEVFAYGLRNPWRIAFDKKTGKLWCGDVGQELWEEVNILTAGGNYGWSNREGNYSFGPRPTFPGVSEPIDPVWAYDHSVGKSITGGRVYRSDRVPELNGKYLYADYVSGAVWALGVDDAGVAQTNEQLVEKGIAVLAFGEDQNGEVFYLVDSVKGQCIYRFESAE